MYPGPYNTPFYGMPPHQQFQQQFQQPYQTYGGSPQQPQMRVLTAVAAPSAAGPSDISAAVLAGVEEEVKELEQYEKDVIASGMRSASEDWIQGYDATPRFNPMTDLLESDRFHHLEFYVGDAYAVMQRFRNGLGSRLVAFSDRTTGNFEYSSYVLVSGELRFVITSATSQHAAILARRQGLNTAVPDDGYDGATATAFYVKHGLAVAAVGVSVTDARESYRIAVENGAIPAREPKEFDNGVVFAEVKLYGEVVLRFVEGNVGSLYLPGYVEFEGDKDREDFGIFRIDHVVGNVHSCKNTFEYLSKFTGWHRFAEFSTDDVGTVDSGLNSIVIANNSERILMPINEPTFGTPRRSQIQIYLEWNAGEGVQHIALKCEDIFATMEKLLANSHCGFEFLPKPPTSVDAKTGIETTYYQWVKERVGDKIDHKLIDQCEKYNILLDLDEQGCLLQIFTRPISTRPTIFLELIERRCFLEGDDIPACGAFGAGNFSKLFQTIEEDMGNLS